MGKIRDILENKYKEYFSEMKIEVREPNIANSDILSEDIKQFAIDYGGTELDTVSEDFGLNKEEHSDITDKKPCLLCYIDNSSKGIGSLKFVLINGQFYPKNQLSEFMSIDLDYVESLNESIDRYELDEESYNSLIQLPNVSTFNMKDILNNMPLSV